MNSFLTGSQVYGKPTEDSDIDLVILCDYTTIQKLADLSDGENRYPIRFGKLNIVAFSNPSEFALWKFQTDRLRRSNPFTTKDEVVESFQELYGDIGLTPKGAGLSGTKTEGRSDGEEN